WDRAGYPLCYPYAEPLFVVVYVEAVPPYVLVVQMNYADYKGYKVMRKGRSSAPAIWRSAVQPSKALDLDFLHSNDGSGGDRWFPIDYLIWHRDWETQMASVIDPSYNLAWTSLQCIIVAGVQQFFHFSFFCRTPAGVGTMRTSLLFECKLQV
ncbi:hypothetical protein PIB30_093688, partial [Stylosanthes scabra]|nr:hypothetical protein [Stylosanthes scabra]